MARRKKLSNIEIEAQAIAIVRGEKERWEDATAFITNKVSFKMRELIRILRKNYYGIFDQPKDPFTGQEKIWYPLTEIYVEAVVKNIDLDQKDVGFRAKNEDGYGITDLIRASVKDTLSRMYFGQKLDNFERNLAIDGTAVWKTFEHAGKLIVKDVDLLNIYIDPTAPSIQEAYRFTERSLMFPDEIASMDWMDTANIEETVRPGLPRTDVPAQTGTMNSNAKMIDVYETWGKIPKSLITGLTEDKDEEVDGRIVVSGLDNGTPRLQVLELNTKKTSEGEALKPYEECWFTRVPGRWYGRGVGEKLLTLQVYANIVFNVRINRSRVSQLGLFKIRKGSGVTPQMLSRLPSNGAVVLNSMEDLEQLVIQEVGQSSYTDEEVINTLAEKLTNAFQVATGESLPASTPATNAALQNTAAKSGFAIIKDGIGFFLERWCDRQSLPIMAKQLTTKKLVRMATDDEQVKEIIDRVVNYYAAEALDVYYSAGVVPSDMELQMAMDDARRRVLAKKDMFIEHLEECIADNVFTQVQITNESMDVAVTLQNIINMIGAAPQYQEPLVKEAFDLMGLGQPPAPKMGMQGMMPGMPMQPDAAQLQQATTSANTL